MPGWGVQGGERSQPFVLSYSQLFFTCASFHNNKREFNFNALWKKKKKKKKHLQYSLTEHLRLSIYASLYEAQTVDRGNKNDINTNTPNSMNPHMQNAKTHTVSLPNQSRAAHSPAFLKERPEWEERHQNKTTVISL